jgi:hypothetical protein
MTDQAEEVYIISTYTQVAQPDPARPREERAHIASLRPRAKRSEHRTRGMAMARAELRTVTVRSSPLPRCVLSLLLPLLLSVSGTHVPIVPVLSLDAHAHVHGAASFCSSWWCVLVFRILEILAARPLWLTGHAWKNKINSLSVSLILPVSSSPFLVSYRPVSFCILN